MTDRFRLVPAAYVLLRRGAVDDPGGDGGEVLLQLRRNTGYRDGWWATAAAGHVEARETVVEAARREAAEELGIAIDPADLVPLTAMHRTHRNDEPIDERVDFFFTCRRWSGEPALQEAAKAADLGWFAVDALPERTVPHERFVIESLRAGGPGAITTFGFA